MKKYLILAFMVSASCFLQAQTKGTNTVGLGMGIQRYKSSQIYPGNSYVSDRQVTGFSISYGQFVRQDEEAGIDLFYGSSTFSNTPQTEYTAHSYGGKLTYQKYFNLIKSFYAFGGGRGGHNYSEGSTREPGAEYVGDYSNSLTTLGAYGGVSWFLSKRFALEADLLSADIGYSKTNEKSTTINRRFETTSSNFSLSSAGAISNLGFKIHFLF